MLTEDFCSFEVAKLLKEKGFDELCIFKYSSEGVRMKAGVAIDEWQNSELDDDEYSCPSQSMAMKWLRNEHNILLFLLPAQENGKLVYLVEVWTWNEEEGIYESTYAPMPRKEPEQAIGSALKYSLENLI